MKPTRTTTVRLLTLLADSRAHTNNEIRKATGATPGALQYARRRIRDHGTYLAEADHAWSQTTDPADIERHLLKRLRYSYAERVRLVRSMHDAITAHPGDKYLARLLSEEQGLAMQLGSRLGLTPMTIATDLTPIAGAA